MGKALDKQARRESLRASFVTPLSSSASPHPLLSLGTPIDPLPLFLREISVDLRQKTQMPPLIPHKVVEDLISVALNQNIAMRISPPLLLEFQMLNLLLLLNEELINIPTFHLHKKPLEIHSFSNQFHQFQILVSRETLVGNLFLSTVLLPEAPMLMYKSEMFPVSEDHLKMCPTLSECLKEIDRDPRIPLMSVLFWNCRGAKKENFSTTLQKLVRVHRPDILILTETRCRIADISPMLDEFPFDIRVDIPIIASKGGVWLLALSRNVLVNSLASCKQELHATVKDFVRGYPI